MGEWSCPIAQILALALAFGLVLAQYVKDHLGFRFIVPEFPGLASHYFLYHIFYSMIVKKMAGSETTDLLSHKKPLSLLVGIIVTHLCTKQHCIYELF